MFKIERIWLFLFIIMVAVTIFFAISINQSSQGGSQQSLSNDNLSGDVQEEDAPKLPDDFPIFEDLSLVESSQTKENGKGGLSQLWESKVSAKILYEFYTQELAKNGWEINQLSQSQDSYTLTFKKENMTGFLGLTKKDSKITLVSVTIGFE